MLLSLLKARRRWAPPLPNHPAKDPWHHNHMLRLQRPKLSNENIAVAFGSGVALESGTIRDKTVYVPAIQKLTSAQQDVVGD